ncbi:MAG: DUF4292 domain-containing protein [Bacteroidota bacterium]|nr:DUF4292 domain-containing protein [Bacteroidota bacterium]
MQIKNYTNKSLFWISALLVCLFLFNDCQRKHLKQIAAIPGAKKRIKKRVKTQNADFKYLSTKSKIEYTDGLDQFSANASIRLAKDSIIWVSVTPALGVEVVRCLISKDSVFVINRIQKDYYKLSYGDLKQKLGFEINFNLVQSMFFGNPPFAETDEDSSTKSQDSVYTILFQKRNNIIIENFIRDSTSKIEKITFEDALTHNTVDVTYEDFRKVENILFAYINKLSLKYKNSKGFQNFYIGIEHHKVEPASKELKFPFNIKQKFERKD